MSLFHQNLGVGCQRKLGHVYLSRSVYSAPYGNGEAGEQCPLTTGELWVLFFILLALSHKYAMLYSHLAMLTCHKNVRTAWKSPGSGPGVTVHTH